MPPRRDPPIGRCAREGPAPLSFAQQRLWFLDNLAAGRPLFSIPHALPLRGPLDTAALERSLRELERRHQALRVRIGEEGGRPFQVVAAPRDFTLAVTACDAGAPGERREQALALLAERAREPFDLANGSPWRTELVRLGDEEHLLYLSAHHAVFDLASLGTLLAELGALYDAFLNGRPASLPEPAIGIVDYAVWERARARDQRLARALAFWKRRLDGLGLGHHLPRDRTVVDAG